MRIRVAATTALCLLAVTVPASAAQLGLGQARSEARRLLHSESVRTHAQRWTLDGCRRTHATRVVCRGSERYERFLCRNRVTVTLRHGIIRTHLKPINPCERVRPARRPQREPDR